MKQLIFMSLLCAGILAACSKSNTQQEPETPVDALTCEDTIWFFVPGDTSGGQLGAVKTCTDWAASAEGRYDGVNNSHIKISGNTYWRHIYNQDTSLFLAELMSIDVPNKTGRFKVNNPVEGQVTLPGNEALISLHLFEEDIFLANWRVDTTDEENFLEITELDPANNRVKGKFQIRFNIENFPEGQPNYPDHLQFINGTFDLLLQ